MAVTAALSPSSLPQSSYGTIRGQQCTGALITSHYDVQQFLGRGDGQLAHAQVIDDKERNRS
jgi:hypothetical protein